MVAAAEVAADFFEAQRGVLPSEVNRQRRASTTVLRRELLVSILSVTPQ